MSNHTTAADPTASLLRVLDAADAMPGAAELRANSYDLLELAPGQGSGGRIAFLGQDWDAFVIDSYDPELTRTIVHARADTLPNPRAAHRDRTLLLDEGFTDVTIEIRTAGVTEKMMLTGLARTACAAGAISRAQADPWAAEQDRRARAGRLFVALPLFAAVATHP